MAKKASIKQIIKSLQTIYCRGPKSRLSIRDRILRESFGMPEFEDLRSYLPEPSHQFIGLDNKGKERTYSEPHHENLALQKLILSLVWYNSHSWFSEYCFSIREKSHTDAAKYAKSLAEQGYIWLLKVDIKDCNDSLDHQLLVQTLKESNLFTPALIRLMLNQTHIPQRSIGKGIPTGHPLSSLFLNMYLTRLDRFIESKGFYFYRVSDDIGLFFQTKREADKAKAVVLNYLKTFCRLEVNSEKTKVDKVWRQNIVGFTLRRSKSSNINISLSNSSIDKIKRNVEEHIESLYLSGDVKAFLYQLNEYLKNCSQSYRLVKPGKQLKELDEWILSSILEVIDHRFTGYQERYEAFQVLFGKNKQKIIKRLSPHTRMRSEEVLATLRREGMSIRCSVVSVYDAVKLMKLKDKSLRRRHSEGIKCIQNVARSK